MRKIILGILFFCLFLVGGYADEKSKSSNINTLTQKTQKKEVALSAFDKLIWETDMDHALDRAKKEHKNVMVMVEDPSCTWCIKMKKGALSDPRVIDKLQSYILLKVERSDKKTAKRIKDFSGAVPSFYFMHPDQELFESVVGYFVTEDFLGYLNDIDEEN
ncbi:thioredoxin family protein [Sulfurovum sp.]|uniref:thioredoxin family protein n=1 Tax=Sulfurovum sp. TaxID=1969726 RepID=UPI00356B33EC